MSSLPISHSPQRAVATTPQAHQSLSAGSPSQVAPVSTPSNPAASPVASTPSSVGTAASLAYHQDLNHAHGTPTSTIQSSPSRHPLKGDENGGGALSPTAVARLPSNDASSARGRGRKQGSSTNAPRNAIPPGAGDVASSHSQDPSQPLQDLHQGSPVSAAASINNNNATTPSATSSTEESTPRASRSQKKQKRRKVDHACVYCRRSHMTCDEGRPCTRCIRRNIGHLCRDEPKRKATATSPSKSTDDGGAADSANSSSPTNALGHYETLPAAAHQSTALVLTATSQAPNSSLVFAELQASKNGGSTFVPPASYSSAPPSPASPSNFKQQQQPPSAALAAANPASHNTTTQATSQNTASNPNTNGTFSHPLSQSLTLDKSNMNAGTPNNPLQPNNQQYTPTASNAATTATGNNAAFSRTPLLNDWLGTQSILSQTSEFNQNLFFSEHANSEFASLGDFLTMIEDPTSNPDLLLPTSLGNSAPGSANISRNGSNTDMAKLAPVLGMAPFSGNNANTNNTGNNRSPSFSNAIAPFHNNDSASNNPSQQMQPPQFSQFGQPQQIQYPQQQHMDQPISSQQPQRQQHNMQPPQHIGHRQQLPQHQQHLNHHHHHHQIQPQKTIQPVVSDSARDKFFLTAADPSVDVSPEERLKQVIRAKVEAGLLQPFNYARGYARLQKYMDNYMNQSSKQRILKPLSVFRPAFRAIAQSLLDVDLVLVEEAFERMLLDYDRVFTSMAIPACLWRRTGEIYRGNKEFAGLVEVSVDDLRDGKLAIYELMSEESAVNYWEKYGSIAFDAGQKAVLTSCNLRTRDGRKRRACCFSFTIQRDCYNIPSCIIGNFIPIHP